MNQLVLKKKNELMKKKKGFTLVELIIVIAVIAVLAAIAIPKFGAVKKDANLRADQANAKIIATAVATGISDGVISASDTVTAVSGDSYKVYIDGQQIPAVKSESGKTFYATYSNGSGVEVYLGENGTKVYPAS
ncbi:prepilin-type N-terminal cleavage/methylation domain-containing protein [Clostridium butyricum]|uniref:prepilin-type N-terminal cleavage/methylation domain-containing protein n=1 Tax=Clostridium butyricum TaxID=1492 RepID=UPI0013D36F94|nr:prepilin-type N-terminal cleavage/methylation domain-containing protein [Clostridium butyricum]MCQ2016728.1 prepilin-type N-terminal cleavage/methylation domain-containing protein [Clostridium butyricum]MCQ2020617.1 prepilin-type N-terminal cleavage/methylation domain-containing protein [Clostridium butyricum]NFB69616.1 prepilin-type N-terminal cleavage/methylation domain-containing protein [Clostridium butyricum]NFB90329.1 prepilin-type N-terminal cleavage/methylation domain-containing prot